MLITNWWNYSLYLKPHVCIVFDIYTHMCIQTYIEAIFRIKNESITKYLLWKECQSTGLGTAAVECDRELNLPLQETLRITEWERGGECSNKEIKGAEIFKARGILLGSLKTAWDGASLEGLLRRSS